MPLPDMLPGAPAGGMEPLADMLPGAPPPGGMLELLDGIWPGFSAGGMEPLADTLPGAPPGGIVALADTFPAFPSAGAVVLDVLLLVHPDIATIDKSSKPITKKLIFFIVLPQTLMDVNSQSRGFRSINPEFSISVIQFREFGDLL